jgi:hypothetical protein
MGAWALTPKRLLASPSPMQDAQKNAKSTVAAAAALKHCNFLCILNLLAILMRNRAQRLYFVAKM